MNDIQMVWRNRIFGLVFLASLAAITGAMWDFAYNGAQFQGFFVGFLVAMVGVTAFVFAYTETEARKVPTLRREGELAFEIQAEADAERQAAKPAAKAPLSARVAPLLHRGDWTVFEEGEILLEPIKTPTNISPELESAQETANVLCGVCGDYFEIDVQPYRPVAVDCASCGSQLKLSGEEKSAPPAKLFCRACHAGYEVPKIETLASYHCIECGTLNKVRAVGEVSATKEGGKKKSIRVWPGQIK